MAGQRVCTGAVLIAVALSCLLSSSQGVTLNMQNQCANSITVYWQRGAQQTPDMATVASGAQNSVNVGASWEAGVVWAGNPNKALAGLAEFTILENGQDTYDLSLVNAYNLGIEIQPVTPTGDLCKDIKCTIAGLEGFCTPDNVYTAPEGGNSEACTNTDGPQADTQPRCCCSTPNTLKFKNACPDAYSFSKDDQSSTFTCMDTTDYNIIFCPAGGSSDNMLPCPQG